MKQSLSFIFAFMTAILLSCDKEEPSTNTGTTNTSYGTTYSFDIQGIATDSLTGNPLENILLKPSEGAYYNSPTDSLGKYTISVWWHVGGQQPVPLSDSFYIEAVEDSLNGNSTTIFTNSIVPNDIIEDVDIVLAPQ